MIIATSMHVQSAVYVFADIAFCMIFMSFNLYQTISMIGIVNYLKYDAQIIHNYDNFFTDYLSNIKVYYIIDLSIINIPVHQ